jgi:hypothetical protein
VSQADDASFVRRLAVVNHAEAAGLALEERNGASVLLPVALLQQEADASAGGAGTSIYDGLDWLWCPRGWELQAADLRVLDRLIVPGGLFIDLAVHRKEGGIVGTRCKLTAGTKLKLQHTAGGPGGDVVEAEDGFDCVGVGAAVSGEAVLAEAGCGLGWGGFLEVGDEGWLDCGAGSGSQLGWRGTWGGDGGGEAQKGEGGDCCGGEMHCGSTWEDGVWGFQICFFWVNKGISRLFCSTLF